MNSRERLLCALDHREPDRIPRDFDSCGVTGIHVNALNSYLEKYYGGRRELNVWHIKEQLAEIPEDVRNDWKIDTRRILASAPSGWKAKITEDDGYRHFTDEWGIRWSMPLNKGLYFDMTYHPLSEVETVEELKKYKWPNPDDPARFSDLVKLDLSSSRYNSFALVASSFMSGMFETALWVRGFEKFFEDLVMNPEYAEFILDKMLELEIVFWEKMLGIVGDDVQVILYSDDVAVQKGMMISPRMYKRYLFPRRKKLYSAIKKISDAKILFHSCGAVRDIIPLFIEEGIDILNPLQISASDMDTAEIKRQFGKDISFWGGGVDTQGVFPHGTPQQVADQVKRQIDILAPGGGFVFNTVHCIQPDVPPENIKAMLDVLDEFGVY
jgi:uroporphyrinogen decarboxylase